MKTKIIVLFFLGLFLSGCCLSSQSGCRVADDPKATTNVVLKDYGAEPLVINIEAATVSNDNFRLALWTGTLLQVTVMSIPAGGEIGLETHPDTDQFIRIEEGQGKVMMGDTEDALTFIQMVEADFAIFVPAGKWHNLVNTGDKPLKVYSIYAPVEHPHSTVHKTPEDDEHHH